MASRSKSEATRAAVLDAAYPLFLNKGFKGVSTREIAKTAGVHENTMFRLFETKAKIYEEAMRGRMVSPPTEELQKESAERSFRSGLHYLISRMLEIVFEDAMVIRIVMLDVQVSPELLMEGILTPIKLKALLSTHLRRGMREGYIRKDVDVEMAAQVVIWNVLSFGLLNSVIGISLKQLNPGLSGEMSPPEAQQEPASAPPEPDPVPQEGTPTLDFRAELLAAGVEITPFLEEVLSKNLSVPPFFKKMALKGVEPPSFIKDMILKGMPLSDPPLFVQEKFLRGEKLPDGRTFEPPKFIQNLLTRGITPKFLPGVVDPSQPQPAEEIREAMMLSDDEPPPGGLPFVFDAQYIANFMTDMLLSAYQPGPQGEVSS